MNLEIMYAFFQMINVLNFMNLEYRQLYESYIQSDSIRKTLYKENTTRLLEENIGAEIIKEEELLK